MEELLPIIIGLIWLAYSFYNKSQKKKNLRKPESQPEEHQKPPSILEQILMGEQPSTVDNSIPYEEFEIEKDIEFEPVVIKEAKSTPFISHELSTITTEGQEAFGDDDKLPMEYDYEKEQVVEKFQDFDLKKAIIFSEILNAPYIKYK